jgi:hypothetical protein
MEDLINMQYIVFCLYKKVQLELEHSFAFVFTIDRLQLWTKIGNKTRVG